MKQEINVVLYLLNIAIMAFAAEPACPVCSKYNYEEMLLERVIRNELALEQTLKDIKETNTKVIDALRKLQDENDRVNTSIETMESKRILMEATWDDVIKTALANASKSLSSHILTESGRAIKEIEGRVERVKGEMQTPTIQFRAQLAFSITVNTGQDVVFSRVEMNDGQGYNKGTGKFTASVAGLYNFAVHYCAEYNKYVYPEIVHHGKSLLKAFNTGAPSAQLCSSLQAYVVMSIGDMVWVRTTSTSHFFQSDNYCLTTFSGVLIRV